MNTRNSRLVAAALALACTGLAGSAAAKTLANDIEIDLEVEIGEPVMLAGRDHTAYIKIALTGFALPQATARAPINLALVLDRSSSMGGDKLEKAKQAALMVLDRLGPDDILSIVTYDSTVEVLVPATKVGGESNRGAIRERILGLDPRGTTALFAGVSHGIEEASKFRDDKRASRIILLSDGQANVGPSSPGELGRLGEAAGKQGIAISTIGLGLGYNEDLMTQLALRSDGNHGFAETADELATIFGHELGDVLSVVAQDVSITVEFPDGVHPVRCLNRDIELYKDKAVLSLNQLYGSQEKYFLLEVKVPATPAGRTRELARVSVGYDNMVTRKRHQLGKALGASFTDSQSEVAKRENREVMVASIEAVAAERNRQAVELRDQGKVQEAQQVLLDNANELARQSKRYKSERLNSYSRTNRVDADNLDNARWNQRRKAMRESQHRIQTNQSY